MKKNFTLIIIISIFFSANAQNINDSLIAHYPFNSNAQDISGNGNNGTVNGATLTTDRFGLTNSAYLFDGLNDYIQVANNSTLDLDKNFTISFWFYQDSFISTGYRIVDKNTAGLGDGYGIDTYGNGGRGIRLYAGSSSLEMDSPHSLLTWHHGAITNDGSKVRIYLNGLQTDSFTANNLNPPTNTFPLLIGCGQKDTGRQNFFKGKLDDIMIYRRALNSVEVVTVFLYTTTSISEETITSNLIYPNPSSSSFFLSSNSLVVEEVVDITGKKINFVNKLDTNSFDIIGSAGIYFVHIKDTNTGKVYQTKIDKTQ